jgi:signal transduction histidine kinase
VGGRSRSSRAYLVVAVAAAFTASAGFFAATTVAVPLRGSTVLVVAWCALCSGAVGVVAWRFGPLFGVPMAVTAALAIDSFYIAPYRAFDSQDWVNYPVTAMYIAIGVFVGAILEATRRRAVVSERAAQAAQRRIVEAGDQARRRIERNLHDGVQQRLVSLALRTRRSERRLPADQQPVKEVLSETVEELNAITEEVREIAQGIHPAILTQGGLGPALRSLARGCSIPVEVGAADEARMPEPVEAAAYYVVAEALANVVKHAEASGAWVEAARQDGCVRVRVRDDGVGGADPSSGSGLSGLRDRVEALGGLLAIRSPRGEGTEIDVTLPVAVPAERPETSG